MANVTTTQVMITSEWTKIAEGQCEVQSVNDRDAFNKTFFDLVVSNTTPSANTDTFLRITLFEHANFHRAAPVWLRLNKVNASKAQPVIVIKEGEL